MSEHGPATRFLLAILEREDRERERREHPARWLRQRLDTSAWPMAHTLSVSLRPGTAAIADTLVVSIITMRVSYRCQDGEERHLTEREARFSVLAEIVRDRPDDAVVLAQTGLQRALLTLMPIAIKPDR